MGKTIIFVIILWLITSYFGGILVIRDAYSNNWEFPSGDRLGYFEAGIGEIISPLWFPILGIGKLILLGIN